MSKARLYNLLIGTLLSFCLFVYVFYRPEGTLVNIILNNIFDSSELFEFKQSVRSLFPLTDAIIYSLPGGIWVFCATLLSQKLRVRVFSLKVNLEWLPLTFALWLELLQYFSLIKGRFDIVDIFFVLLFGLLAKYLMLKRNFQQQMLRPINKRSVAFALVFISVFMAHVFD